MGCINGIWWKRVCNLKRGELFRWYGTLYKVVAVGQRVTYRPATYIRSGGMRDSFGINNKMKVEVYV